MSRLINKCLAPGFEYFLPSKQGVIGTKIFEMFIYLKR